MGARYPSFAATRHAFSRFTPSCHERWTRFTYQLLLVVSGLCLFCSGVGECSPLIDSLIEKERTRLLPCSDKPTVAILGTRGATLEVALRRETNSLAFVNRQIPALDLCQVGLPAASRFAMYFIEVTTTAVGSTRTRVQIGLYRTDNRESVYRSDDTVPNIGVDGLLEKRAAAMLPNLTDSTYRCRETFTIDVMRTIALTCQERLTPPSKPPSIDDPEMTGRLLVINHRLIARSFRHHYVMRDVPLRANMSLGSPRTITGEARIERNQLQSDNTFSGQTTYKGGCTEAFTNPESTTFNLFSATTPATYSLRIPQLFSTPWALTLVPLPSEPPLLHGSAQVVSSKSVVSQSGACPERRKPANDGPVEVGLPHFEIDDFAFPSTTRFSLCAQTGLREAGFQRVPNMTTLEGADVTSRCSKNEAVVTTSVQRVF